MSAVRQRTVADQKTANVDANKELHQMDRSMLTVVFIALLLDLLAFTMILPLLPALLDYYADHDTGHLYSTIQSGVSGFRNLIGAPDTPRWNSVLFGGVIGSLFSFLQFVSSPMIGAASDVYGRRPLMIISMMGIASSYLIWAFSKNFGLFVLSRIIGGVSKGNVSLSTAVVTDITTAQKRGLGMAVVGVAFSFGFILGPLIGAFFSQLARASEGEFFSTPALFAMTLAISDVVFIWFFFKETLPASKRAKSLSGHIHAAADLIVPKNLFDFKAVGGASEADLGAMKRLGKIYFIFLFLYSGLEFTLTFLVHNRFDFDSMQQGKMFFFIGIVMIIVQGGFVRRVKPGNEQKVALVGLWVIIPSFLMIGFAFKLWLLYLGLIFFSIGSATVVPLLTATISSYGRADQKGTVLGVFRSLGALARALGPIITSTVYWSCGPVTCYTVGAIGLSIPVFLMIQHRKLDS